MKTKFQFQKKKVEEPSFDMGPINSIIGTDGPSIEATPLGEHRLNQALKKKFGEGYRNIPKAQEAIKHFQNEKRFFSVYRKLKAK